MLINVFYLNSIFSFFAFLSLTLHGQKNLGATPTANGEARTLQLVACEKYVLNEAG